MIGSLTQKVNQQILTSLLKKRNNTLQSTNYIDQQLVILYIKQIRMGKQRGKIGKYCKISLQKKFQLLKLTQWGKINLKQTSEHLNINYSTAKTIFFQFQNKKARQKLTFFEDQIGIQERNKNTVQKKVAAYKMTNILTSKSKKIKVICTENRCEMNQGLSLLYQQQNKQKAQILMVQQSDKCQTVHKNCIKDSENNINSTTINARPQIINFYQNQDLLQLSCYWQNISYQNAIMNLGQFPYCIDFMGTSLTFPFLLAVPQ